MPLGVPKIGLLVPGEEEDSWVDI
nr:clp protease proteolytic subunit [Cymbaria mongolica]UYS85101.1 clp protease proteolytic subunit [Cymbaria mongolica]